MDLLIRDAVIIDGTGRSRFSGDIGICDGRIAGVGRLGGEGRKVIEGRGMVASPGFIDIHSHADLNILQYPDAESLVMQGVTTFVGGNCGLSMGPMKDFVPWGIAADAIVGAWWGRVEPGRRSPPQHLALDAYGASVEKYMGFRPDWLSFAEFLAKVEGIGLSVNYVPLVGHNSIRLAVMGQDFKQPASEAEVRLMSAHVEAALGDGAFGLTTGLDGGPGDFATTEELVALAKAARRSGGLYATHTRNMDNNYPPAAAQDWGYGICHGLTPNDMPFAKYYGLVEALEVARRARIPVQISHLVPAYTIYQGYTPSLQAAAAEATLTLIDAARDEGSDVAFDLIPELDGEMMSPCDLSLLDLFPAWLHKLGSRRRFVKMLGMSDFRDELRREISGGTFKFLMCHPKTDPFWPERIRIVEGGAHGQNGLTLSEVARDRGVTASDALFDAMRATPDALVRVSDPRWTEEIARAFVRHPAATIGADEIVAGMGRLGINAGDGPPSGGLSGLSVASYNAYPRYLRTFVNEKGIISLEEAIRKATSAPAERMGIADRGVIREGAWADLVLFDDGRIGEGELFGPASVTPRGISRVIVNGVTAYEDLVHTGARPGKVLRRE